MSSTPSVPVLPRHLDPRKFAQQGLSVEGQVDICLMERLLPLLANKAGNIKASLSFGVDEQGARTVTGQIKATLSLVCQRCLGACEQTMSLPIQLGIVWSDEQAGQLRKDLDPWVLQDEGQTDIYPMLEDEIILGLPIVAYHDSECIASSLYTSAEDGIEAQEVDADRADNKNPFQVLQELKSSLKTSPDKSEPDATH